MTTNQPLFITTRSDGLGARLIYLLNVVRLSKATGGSPIIFWPDEPLHCSRSSFQSVFSDFQIKQWFLNNNPYEDFHIWLKKSKIENLKILRSDGFDTNDLEKCPAYFLANKADCIVINNEKYTNARLQASMIFNQFFINPIINKKLEDYVNTQGHKLSNSLGLHIRRGDMASNDKYFKRCVKVSEYCRIIEAHPESMFYVSTDRPQIFFELEKLYGNRVYRMEVNSFKRNESDILLAMCELIVLSKTQRIYGGQSCFSRAASIIGNIELIILNERLQKPE
jgi:hypothetical protein